MTWARVATETTLDGQWTYSYDAIGELTHAVFASNNPSAIPNQDLQYSYDAAGNRTQTIINGVTTDYVTNNLNQYTSIGNETLDLRPRRQPGLDDRRLPDLDLHVQ